MISRNYNILITTDNDVKDYIRDNLFNDLDNISYEYVSIKLSRTYYINNNIVDCNRHYELYRNRDYDDIMLVVNKIKYGIENYRLLKLEMNFVLSEVSTYDKL